MPPGENLAEPSFVTYLAGWPVPQPGPRGMPQRWDIEPSHLLILGIFIPQIWQIKPKNEEIDLNLKIEDRQG